jgi:Zn-dependent alcohol dehydrogenase
MKKAFLIAAGTITGLGAVLSITPPALSESVGTVGLGGGADLGGGAAAPAATPSASASSAPTSAPTQGGTAKPTPAQSARATAKPTASATATATATPTPVVPATSGFSGTVNGASYSARNYGTVSVSATFANGKIASVSASQSPRSWSEQAFTVLVPWVNAGSITIEQVKQYSAAELPCARSNSCNSRASYTAEAFWNSLKSAITKAGL